MNSKPKSRQQNKMNRTSLLIFTFLLISFLTTCTPEPSGKNAETASKPNIVFIMTDDQGWGDLSWSGNTNIETPNIDGIANEAAKVGIPVIALGGKLDLEPEQIDELGLLAAFSISDGPMDLPTALANTETLLKNTAYNIGRLFIQEVGA